ncbi:MAG: exonuclease domain-containing protein [Lachnospiraceae bacterium]|nr:exonuclease domain-containing protein [Lachnospiraceae bacterium]
MNYIILDLEWNQSRCKSNEIKEMPFEIIEIGAIKLDNQKREIGSFHELIKPEAYLDLNRVTKTIVHMEIEELNEGAPFVETMKRFLEWCGREEYIFCTWGPLDLLELQRNMKYHNMEPLSLTPIAFLDMQKLFSRQYEDKKTRRTLEYAVDFLHIEKDVPFHRAFSDAYYTAKIMTKISEKTQEHISYDVFHIPKQRQQEIYKVFYDYAKYISREFATKTAAMADREVISTRCYICNRNLQKQLKWFTSNGRHYYSISVCPVHGNMKGKIRIRKTEENMYYVVKTLKFITEEEKAEILSKREKVSLHRKKGRKMYNQRKNISSMVAQNKNQIS